MKKATILLISLIISTLIVSGNTFAANPLIDNVFHITDSQNRPVPGGKVYTYEPGTTTPKVTYSDEAGTIPHTNPVILDSEGKAMVYGEGSYTINVEDMFGGQVNGWPKVVDVYITLTDLNTKVTKIDTIADLRTHTGYTGESVQVLGYYTPGDGGGGPLRVWKTGGSYTDNGGSVITPDGIPGTNAWVWEYSGTIEASWFGATGSGDDAPFLNAAFEAYDSVELLPYHKVLSTIDVGVNKRIVTPGESIIDGNFDEFDSSVNREVLKAGTETITQISDIASDVSREDQSLEFSSAHGLSVGDIICIYNPTDFTFSSARAEYRAGEFCEVARVDSSTVVQLSNGLYDDYVAADVDIYKMDTSTFSVSGKLKVISTRPTTGGSITAVRLNQLLHSDISNITATALNASYAAIFLVRCYGVSGTDVTAIQETLSGFGGDYGLGIINSQHIDISGYFSASRHAITHGGFNGPCYVSNRDCTTSGTVKTTTEGQVAAWDAHGNAEDLFFDGLAYGGVITGGSGVKIRGTIYGDDRGLCIVGSEVRTFDHDFSGVTLITDKNPFALASSRGVIDFGGNNTFEVDNMKGGTLNLQNVTIKAPNAERGVVVRLRNSSVSPGNLSVNTRGMNIDMESSGIPVRTVSDVGKNFSKVLLSGIIHNSASSTIGSTDYIENHKEVGYTSYTTTTSVSVVDIPVVFDQPYSSQKLPVIHVSLDRSAIGGYINGIAKSITTTGFTLSVYTLNGSNFGAAVTDDAMWTAE